MDSKSPSPGSSVHNMNKTSSAGGDYHIFGRGSNKLPNLPITKFKLQPVKSKKIKKKSKKLTRPNASIKTTFGSLKNAIVLAPFHSLKRCFQNKLVDFYSQEKIKKNKQTIKKGNKKNLSFEYDVMEVNAIDEDIPKKDKKAPKGKKKKDTLTEKKTKGNKTKQSSYFCNCKETKAKEGGKTFPTNRSGDLKRPKKARRSTTRSSTAISSLKDSQVPSTSSGEVECKRRRVCDRVIYDSQNHPSSSGVAESKKKRPQSPNSGSCLAKPRFTRSLTSQNSNECIRSGQRSDTNWSISGLSSRSRNDSWEEYSDSFSASEGPVEESLAMSTGSANSRRSRSNKMVSSKTSSTNNVQKNNDGKKKRKDEKKVRDFPTTESYNARHLAIGVDTSNSDEEITDFMDREPQSNMTTEMTTTCLTPLRRKSGTKRQANENVAASSYFLRSFSHSFGGQFRKLSDLERIALNLQDQTIDIQKSLSEGISNKRKSGVTLSEVHSETESQGNVPVEKRMSPPNNTDNSSAINPSVDAEVCNTSSQPKVSGIFDSPQESEITAKTVTEPSSDLQRVSLSGNIALAQTGTNESIADAQEGREENKRRDDSFTNKDKSESSVVSDEGLLQSMENCRWYEGSSNNKQAQNKEPESNFIFGQGNASDGLGDSCELSFGLNWVLSDDEESNHKEKFF